MKFTYKLLLALAAVSLVFTACDNEEDDIFVEDLVVQSMMYVGQPMRIRLEHSIPWDAYYDSDQVGVSGAEIRISVDGTSYELAESDSGRQGTYTASSSAPLVETGAHYDLFISHDGDTITASTIAAGPLDFLGSNIQSSDPASPDTFEYGERDSVNVVINPTVWWETNANDRGYAVLVENMEDNWFEDDQTVGEDNGPCESNISALLSEKEHGVDTLRIPPILLCAVGLHQVRVFSCDQALFDYFQTTYLGNQENYPTTNLSNGLGVFWAGDADTTYFYLMDDIED